MAEVRSLLPSFRHLFLFLFLHLGCLFFSLAPTSNHQLPSKRRKISPFFQASPSRHHASRDDSPAVAKSPRGSPLTRLFCFSRQPNRHPRQPHPPVASHHPPGPVVPTSSPAVQQQQLRHYLASPDSTADMPATTIAPSGLPAKPVGVVNTNTVAGPVKCPSFASRADIFPCASCGEVFNKAHLLDLHQATKHAFCELSEGDSGKNIVWIIFQSGWKGRGEAGRAPTIHRILKVLNSPKTLARFEEYRDVVRSRAAARGDERCMVDGNERLRFYCATFLCSLGREGNMCTCGSPFCTACGIVRHGFSGKDADGISTHATGWAAHASLPEELEREFAFMHVRRAMIVCRVVAGRVALGKAPATAAGMRGHRQEDAREEYDSVVAASAGRDYDRGTWTVEDELVVFNARAVLPCFLLIYSV